MPVGRRGIEKVVRDVDLDQVSLVHDQRRPPEVRRVVGVGVGLGAGQELFVRPVEGEVEVRPRENRWYPERVVGLGAQRRLQNTQDCRSKKLRFHLPPRNPPMLTDHEFDQAKLLSVGKPLLRRIGRS